MAASRDIEITGQVRRRGTDALQTGLDKDAVGNAHTLVLAGRLS